jgi:hypothetical protein
MRMEVRQRTEDGAEDRPPRYQMLGAAKLHPQTLDELEAFARVLGFRG